MSQNETWTIVGTSLGGATPANDATFTVTSVDGSGAITGFTITGTTGLTTQPTGDIVSTVNMRLQILTASRVYRNKTCRRI